MNQKEIFAAGRVSFLFSFFLVWSVSVVGAPEVYEPRSGGMDGIDPGLPESHRAALFRINEYREAAGLEPWVYDPELSRMAQKHADYVLINCKGGRPHSGHFERKGYPGYTKEGDEAARTSGLSGGSDPFYGLELLMAGPYHRKQFLTVGPQRVGIGFTYDRDSHCSSTLFVNRDLVGQQDGGTTAGSSRFSVFPPDGFTDVLHRFERETPDPRPAKWRETTTGYPLSVCMSGEDARSFVSSKATMVDGHGRRVSIQVADPARPFTRRAPGSIYAPGTGDTGFYFGKNAYCVFVFPEHVLRPGERYRVDLSMKIGSESHRLQWSFQTRGNRSWPVTGDGELRSLPFIARHAIEGDEIVFAEGTHVFDPGNWLSDVKRLTLRGEGMGRTILTTRGDRAKASNLFHFFPGTYAIQDLTFLGERHGLFYAQSQSQIHMTRVEIRDARHGAFYLAQGNEIQIQHSRFFNIGAKDQWSFCFSDAKEGMPAAKAILLEGNYFEKIHTDAAACGRGFETNPGRRWKVGPQSDPDGGVLLLEDALKVVPENEVVEMGPGHYTLADRIWIRRNLILTGSGPDRTILEKTGEGSAFNILENKQARFSSFAFVGAGSPFYLRPSSRARIQDIKSSGERASYFVVLEEGAVFQIDSGDFRQDRSAWFAYLRPSSKEARMEVSDRVRFGQTLPRNGGKGIIRGFKNN